MGLALFVMRSEWERDLSGAAGYIARAHAFRRQLEHKEKAERLRLTQLAVLEQLMTRSTR
jgi:hypothetical protein